MMFAALIDYITGIMLLIGALFALAAAIGILRFPDFYSRMHPASKAGTLGSGVMLIALAIHIGETSVAMRAIAGVIFFLLTAPVSAHLLTRAAYLAGYPMWKGSVVDAMAKSSESRGER